MKESIDFIGIGCQKCATTSVFGALAHHPLIIPPRKGYQLVVKKGGKDYFKECHYWSNSIKKIDISMYHKIFWGSLLDQFVYGEFTPNYILFEESLRKIYQYNPRIKLIAVFRNPVERLYSEYLMFRSYEKYSLSFRELIEKYSACQEPVIKFPMQPEIWPIYRSCYGRQVRKVLNVFNLNQVIFLKTDELKNFSSVMNRLCSFLGVKVVPVPDAQLNVGNKKSRKKVPFYNELLDRFFFKEIEQLEMLTGLDCSAWKVTQR